MKPSLTNTLISWLATAALFAVLIVPTVVTPSMFFLYITGKAYTFRILVEVAFALWLILALRDRSYLPKWSWILGALGVFTIIVGIADVAGVEPLRSLSSNYERMEGFNFISHLFLYFIAISGMSAHFFAGIQEKSIRLFWVWFAHASLLVSLIVGVNGLIQLGGNPTMRIDSFLGNSTYLGIYALFHIFIALYFFVNALYRVRAVDENSQRIEWHMPSIIKIVGYAVIGVFNLYIMYHTGTRGSMLGLFVGLIFIALMLALFEKRHRAIRITGISILGLVILSTVLLGAFKQSEYVKSHNLLARFSELATFDVKSVFENQGHGRRIIWGIALKGFTERPILGWGQDNFTYVFSKYYDPAAYGQESWFDRTHNVFLDWLIAGGVLGLISYLALYGTMIYAIWRRKDESFSLAEKSVLTGLLIAHFIHNLFVFDNLSSYIAFFSVLAFVHVMTARRALFPSYKGVSDDSEVQNCIVLPVVVILLGLSVYFVNVRGVQANRTLIQALIACKQQQFPQSLALFERTFAYDEYVSLQEAREQAVSCATSIYDNPRADAETQKKWVAFVEQIIATQLSETPNDTRSVLYAGVYMNETGRYADAVKYLTRANELSPRKQQILLQLGRAYLNLGDTEKGLAVFESIYKTSPDYEQGKESYAAALVFAGQEGKANEVFGATSTVMTSDQIIAIYELKKQYEKVIDVYRIRAAQSPTDARVAILPRVMYFKYGMKAKAVLEFEKLKAIFPPYKDELQTIIDSINAGKDPFVKENN